MSDSSSRYVSSLFHRLAVFSAAVVTVAGCGGPAAENPSATPPTSSITAPDTDANARALLPAVVRDRGTLNVANSLAYPPFEFTTTDGRSDGFNIDLINSLGSTLGLTVDISQVPFESEITGLTNNRYDVAMASFTITPERRALVDFVQFLNAGSVVSVLKGTDDSITGTDTLCGHSVGVITGSAAETQVADLANDCTDTGKPQIDVSAFPNQSALVQALLNGRVDAKFDDSTTTAYVSQQVGGKFEDVSDAYAPTPNGFAVAKNQPDLLRAMAAAMQTLIDDGTYGDILTKWGQDRSGTTAATVYTATEPPITVSEGK